MQGETIVRPIVDPKEWAERYTISVRSNPCVNCRKILIPTIPYAHGRWRGLISEPHGCKSDFDFSVVTKATAEERQEIIEYFFAVQGLNSVC